jgi:O-antigen ligase
MSARLVRLYVLVAISALCVMPYVLGIQPRELNSADVLNSGEGDAARQVVLLALYGSAALLLLRPSLRLLFIGWPLLLLLLLCLASAIWSVNPDGSLRRLVALSGTVMLGVCIGIRLDLTTMARTVVQAAALVFVASIIVSIVDPGAAFDPENRFRGMFAHKNMLSSFAVIAMFTIFFCLLRSSKALSRLWLGMLFVLCLVCLLISGSAGPFPALFCSIVILGLCYGIRANAERFIAIFPVTIAIGMVVVPMFFMTEGFGVLGRGDDFSGRLQVWQFALSKIAERPLLGYGYGVFWLGTDAPAVAFWRATHNFAPHAHNGFLQLALDAGIVGVGLYAASLLVFSVRAYRLIRARHEISYLFWAIGIFSFFAITNLGEAEAWVGNGLQTMLFVYLVVRINVEHAKLVAEKRSVYGPSPDFADRSVPMRPA